MCNPALAAGASVLQGIQQQNAAVDAANRQNAAYRENVNNSFTAFQDENRSLNRRIGQESDAKAQNSFAKMIEALRLQGRAQTAAGEAGVSGNSVSALLNDLTRQEGVAQNTISRNFENTKMQLEDQKTSTQATFKNRVNSVQKGYAPSAGDAMLGIALNAGTSYYSAQQGQDALATAKSNRVQIAKLSTKQ